MATKMGRGEVESLTKRRWNGGVGEGARTVAVMRGGGRRTKESKRKKKKMVSGGEEERGRE